MEDRKKPHQPKHTQLPKAHQAKQSKLVHHFFYKATIFTIFLVILPFLPSLLPVFFINPRIDSISWELLQLVLVGIAVSYGLFSNKNEQNIDHKEHNFSFASRLLHVSSVFDHVDENTSLFDDNKIQTWSSQYYREKPIVMVGKESSDLEEQIATSSRINENPLLLSTRSLKSLVSEPKNSVSNRFVGNSRKSANGDVMRMIPPKVEERTVFPSPIPWRSRSGKMELKIDDVNSSASSNPLFSSSLELRSKGENVDATHPPSPSFHHTPYLHKSKSGLSKNSDFLEMDLKTCISDKPLQRKSVRTIRPKLKDLEENLIKDQLMQEKGNNSIGVVVKVNDSALPGSNHGSNPPKTKLVQDTTIKDIAFSGSNHGSIPHNTKLVQEKHGLMQQRLHDLKKESLMHGFIEDLNVENNYGIAKEKHFEGSSKENGENADDGPDVDKKADEFIAKFREQIRLQRIESIRRSTNQPSRNHSR